MKKIIYLFVLTLLTISCSEGDIIEDDINFTAVLENCSNANDFVFFKIDSEKNQALSLNFTSTSFELNELPETDLTETITINGTTNTLIYRKFDAQINGEEYFCSSIPPSNVLVTRELISASGTAMITYVLVSGTTNTYTRTITLSDVTFKGVDIEIRQELFEFGEEEVTIP